jgi:hypothetical protein
LTPRAVICTTYVTNVVFFSRSQSSLLLLLLAAADGSYVAVFATHTTLLGLLML